jgi:hypothetical protein
MGPEVIVHGLKSSTRGKKIDEENQQLMGILIRLICDALLRVTRT